MRKILILIGSFDIGGTEKQLFNILKYIDKSFDIHICLIEKRGAMYEDFSKLNITIHHAFDDSKKKIVKLFNIFLNLKKIYNKVKPSIIHFYLPAAYILGGLCFFFKRKVKFIMSRRSLNLYQQKYFFIKWIEIFLHKRMNFIIANSRIILNQLISEEYVDPKKCRLIYNGVLKKKIKKKKENQITKILFLANIINYKNHKMVVEACKNMKCKNKWRINCVGNFSDEVLLNSLQNLIKKYKLHQNIFFLGSMLDVSDELESSDIGILVSTEEGLSNSLLEYLSYSLPVIATDVGGNSEIVQNEVNGFLVKSNDSVHFSKVLSNLIDDNNLRYVFSRNGHKLVSKKYNLDNCVKEYLKFYRSI